MKMTIITHDEPIEYLSMSREEIIKENGNETPVAIVYPADGSKIMDCCLGACTHVSWGDKSILILWDTDCSPCSIINFGGSDRLDTIINNLLRMSDINGGNMKAIKFNPGGELSAIIDKIKEIHPKAKQFIDTSMMHGAYVIYDTDTIQIANEEFVDTQGIASITAEEFLNDGINKKSNQRSMKIAIRCSITTEMEKVMKQLKDDGYPFLSEPTIKNYGSEVMQSGLDHVFINDGYITCSNERVCRDAGYRIITAETFLYGENTGVKQTATKIQEYLDRITRLKADLYTVEVALLQGRRNGGTPITDEILDEIKKDPRFATKVLLESYEKLRLEIETILNKDVIEC